jgi:hypothetical protein
MKQKDLALVILIAGLAGFFSFFITRTFIVKPASQQQKAEVVEAISSEFILPDKQFFNEKSINPTKLIEIGGGQNQQPF